MPVPTPNAGESKNDFISRCMSNNKMQSEYPTQDQRLAVCHTSWRDKKEMKAHKAIVSTLKKVEKQLQSYVQKIAVQEKETLFMNEIPVNNLIQYSHTGQLLFKSIYIKNRVAGNSIQKSLDTADSFVGRDDKHNKMMILKQIENDLKNMVHKKQGDSHYQDISYDFNDEDIAITTPDQDDEGLVGKAEPKEGDTKMIFGNKMEYSGGKWVPTSGSKKEEKPKGEDKELDEMESGDIKKPTSIKTAMPKSEYDHWVETGEMKTNTAEELYNNSLINSKQYEYYTGQPFPVGKEVIKPRSIKDGMPENEYKEWVETGTMNDKTAQKLFDYGLINQGQYDRYTNGDKNGEK